MVIEIVFFLSPDFACVCLMLVVCLVPVRLCKPVFKEREIRISKEQTPCHTEVSDPPITSESVNLADLHLRQIADRIEGLQFKIKEVKEMVRTLFS